MNKPIFDDVTVKLVGEDGNAFLILGRVKRALVDAGHAQGAENYYKEATTGNYDNLLVVTMKYVNVE